MIVFWIFLGIFLLFLTILFTPVHLIFDYHDKPKVYFRIFFLQFESAQFINKLLQKDDKKERSVPKASGSSETKKKRSPTDVLSFVEFLSHLAEVIHTAFNDFFSKAKVNLKELHISIGSEDAANTAIFCATTLQAVNGFCAVLQQFSHFRCNSKNLSVSPNFILDESKFSLHLDISSTVIHIIGVYFRTSINFFKLD